jgi:hypothetical protein
MVIPLHAPGPPTTRVHQQARRLGSRDSGLECADTLRGRNIPLAVHLHTALTPTVDFLPRLENFFVQPKYSTDFLLRCLQLTTSGASR